MVDVPITVLQNILRETSSAAFAAAVGALLTISWTRTTRALKFRRLRGAFGRRVTTHRDAAISVPLWLALENNRLAVRFAKRDFQGHEELYYGPDEMFSRNDMFAAASVINLFGDFFSKPVIYLNDQDEPIWAQRAVVIIGAPVANLHSRRFCSSVEAESKYSMIPRFVEIPEDSVTGARTKIVVPDTGLEFASSPNKDYGAVLRFSNPHCRYGDYYIFVVAGIHAESTQEAGRILRDNWLAFTGKGHVKALVFEMERGRQLTGRIIHKVGIT